MSPRRRNALERLREPVPWRPALQVGDSGYPVGRAHLRAMIRRAEGVRRR